MTSGIAWGLIPSHTCDLTLPSCFTVSPGQACCTKSSNYGWRYTMYTLGGITRRLNPADVKVETDSSLLLFPSICRV